MRKTMVLALVIAGFFIATVLVAAPAEAQASLGQGQGQGHVAAAKRCKATTAKDVSIAFDKKRKKEPLGALAVDWFAKGSTCRAYPSLIQWTDFKLGCKRYAKVQYSSTGRSARAHFGRTCAVKSWERHGTTNWLNVWSYQIV